MERNLNLFELNNFQKLFQFGPCFENRQQMCFLKLSMKVVKFSRYWQLHVEKSECQNDIMYSIEEKKFSITVIWLFKTRKLYMYCTVMWFAHEKYLRLRNLKHVAYSWYISANFNFLLFSSDWKIFILQQLWAKTCRILSNSMEEICRWISKSIYWGC